MAPPHAPPVVLIYVFLLQVLHGNTAMTHRPRLSRKRFTPAAYGQARKRLPLAALRRRLHETGVPWRENAGRLAADRGCDHRTWRVDGSSGSMPDTPALQKHFGQPGGQQKGGGFPVAHRLVLLEAASGRLLDVLVSPLRTHDLSRVAERHRHLQPGDVLLGDRGFCSYAHLAGLWPQGVPVVFRVHQKQIVDFRPYRRAAQHEGAAGRPRSRWFARCGNHDQLVLWPRPQTVSRTMTPAPHAALPQYIVVRELRYHVRTAGFRTRPVALATTLLNPEAYPPPALAELYRQPWQVETNLRHLKQSLGLAVLKSHTVAGVEKEILVFARVYDLVQSAVAGAAATQGVARPRISLVDALRHLRWPLAAAAPPALWVHPLRPGRGSTFTVMLPTGRDPNAPLGVRDTRASQIVTEHAEPGPDAVRPETSRERTSS